MLNGSLPHYQPPDVLIAAALLILSLVPVPRVPLPFSQPSGPPNLGYQRPLSPTAPPTRAAAIPAKGTAPRGTPYAARAPPQLRLCQPQIRFWPARSKAVRRLHARFLPHNQSNIAHLVKSRSKTGLDLCNSKGLTTEHRASTRHRRLHRLARCSEPRLVSASVCTYRIASPALLSPAFPLPSARPPLVLLACQEPLDAVCTANDASLVRCLPDQRCDSACIRGILPSREPSRQPSRSPPRDHRQHLAAIPPSRHGQPAAAAAKAGSLHAAVSIVLASPAHRQQHAHDVAGPLQPDCQARPPYPDLVPLREQHACSPVRQPLLAPAADSPSHRVCLTFLPCFSASPSLCRSVVVFLDSIATALPPLRHTS